MSFEYEDGDPKPLTFYCDYCPTTVKFTDGADFVKCSLGVERQGWQAFKKAGRPWEHACPVCVPGAKILHERHKRQEQEHERQRLRNS
jgi:hypothetical protein